METNNSFPRWVVSGLGVLLMLFVLLLIVQKGYDLNNTFKNAKPANTISVSGEGKVQATPDLATVTMGVLSQGTTAIDVKNQNNDKVNQVISFIKAKGIDTKDISTSQFSFYPQQNYNITSGTPKITGFQGNQSITVKVHGVDKDQTVLEKVLDGAVNNGANEVDGVNLSFEKPDDLQQQARKLAIGNAKTKAQELAQEAGLSLGKVVSISEANTVTPGPIPFAANAVSAGMAQSDKTVAPNIQTGSQEIDETMSVTFEVK